MFSLFKFDAVNYAASKCAGLKCTAVKSTAVRKTEVGHNCSRVVKRSGPFFVLFKATH